MRLENNYIDKNIMQEKVDEGVIMTILKGNKYKYSGTVTVRLLIKRRGMGLSSRRRAAPSARG